MKVLIDMNRFTPNEFKALIAVILAIHGKPIEFSMKDVLNTVPLTGKLELLVDSDTEFVTLTDFRDKEINNENSTG